MNTKAIKVRKGNTAFLPYVERTVYVAVMDAEFESDLLDGNKGLCIACGAEASGVEPDARRYVCDACEAPKVYGLEELLIKVYGLEELLIMGYVQ
jgi:hypothetical protein